MAAPTIAQYNKANNASAATPLALGTIGTSGTVNFAPVAGDLIIAWGLCERATATSVISGGPTTWNLLQNNSNTNHTNGIYWKRLAAGDLPAALIATPSGAVTRRQTGGFVILHNAADPVINNKTAVSATSPPSTASANAMTPAVADSLLMTLFSSCAPSSPFIRSFSAHTSSFTELNQDSGQAAASSNPYFVMSYKALTGGTSSQTFDSVSMSSASEYNATSFVIAPNTNAPPTATLTPSVSSTTALSTFTLTLGGTDDVAVASGALTQLSGTTATPALTSGTAGMPGAVYTVTAPSVLGGTTLVYGYTTYDTPGLPSSQATASIDVDTGTSGAPTVAQVAGAGLASANQSLALGTVGSSGTVNFAPVVGDLVLAWGTAERGSATPVINGGSTPWNPLQNMANTNHMTGVYWKRITAGDLTMAITADTTSTTTRRMSGGFAVLHHSLDPVINNKTAVGPSSPPTAMTANTMTPTVDDSMLLTLFTSVALSSPYARSIGGWANGFTEILEVTGSASALTNPFSALASKVLIGGSGVSQAMGAASLSSAGEYNALSIVLAPGTVNLAPTANITADLTTAVEPGRTVTLTITDSDDITATGSLTRTLTQTSGTTVTLTGSGGNGSTRTFPAPYTLTGDTLVFEYVVNDGTLDSDEAFVGVTVNAADWRIVTVAGAVPTEVPLMIRIE